MKNSFAKPIAAVLIAGTFLIGAGGAAHAGTKEPSTLAYIANKAGTLGDVYDIAESAIAGGSIKNIDNETTPDIVPPLPIPPNDTIIGALINKLIRVIIGWLW